MVTKKKTTVAPSKTIVATEAKPVARAVRRRQVAKGDVPPVLTEEGIEGFTVRAAVEGAQAAKMGAMRDVIAGMSPEESAALLRGLLKQQGESAEELSISPDDELVKDWRDGGYPYKNLMQRRNYERQKYRLQVELLKLQAWVKETGQKVVILFEGRDAAGKGGTIKRFMEHLNPRGRASWRWKSRATWSVANGTSSATCSICQPMVRS